MTSLFKTIIDNDTHKFCIIDPLQYSVIQGRIIDINFPPSSVKDHVMQFGSINAKLFKYLIKSRDPRICLGVWHT